MAGDKIIDKLHFEACKKREESYIDPASGYRVFTSVFLDKREDCCGCACRHCPFEYENVEKNMRKMNKSRELRKFYRSLAENNLGRQVCAYATKKIK